MTNLNDLSALGKTLQDAQRVLEESNARAAREKAIREWKAFCAMADSWGLCNLVGFASDYAGEKEAEGEAQKDYEFAQEILELCARACDIPYENDFRASTREERLKDLIYSLKQVKP